MIRLTDEEIISNTQDACVRILGEQIPAEHISIDLAKPLLKAQLRKVYDWGNEDCPHNPKPIRLKVKRGCLACWQALLEEANSTE